MKDIDIFYPGDGLLSFKEDNIKYQAIGVQYPISRVLNFDQKTCIILARLEEDVIKYYCHPDFIYAFNTIKVKLNINVNQSPERIINGKYRFFKQLMKGFEPEERRDIIRAFDKDLYKYKMSQMKYDNLYSFL